mmetsp:Transcript_15739/g.24819  ORF Transcript_15739/g.24819 Transcript_15739/m.24819 type:complete len:80 (-) Transcript_15739:311-550(-)
MGTCPGLVERPDSLESQSKTQSKSFENIMRSKPAAIKIIIGIKKGGGRLLQLYSLGRIQRQRNGDPAIFLFFWKSSKTK